MGINTELCHAEERAHSQDHFRLEQFKNCQMQQKKESISALRNACGSRNCSAKILLEDERQ